MGNQSGFSLVELAISVTIIGVLIGGVVKGQDVLNAARITAIASDFNRYESALTSFEDMYFGTPGDLSVATVDIINCNNGTNCANGNGDGVVGEAVDDWDFDNAGAGFPKEETTQFWKHMALAGFIQSVAVDADPANPEWGVTHPKAAMTGGYTVIHGVSRGNDETTTLASENGLWIYLRKLVAGAGFGNTEEGLGVVSPLLAKSLDRKIDDGHPFSGKMIVNVANQFCGTEDQSTFLPSNSKSCIIWYKLR